MASIQLFHVPLMPNFCARMLLPQFSLQKKCCLCVLLNIEHIIKNITIESHTADCLPWNIKS